MSQETRDLATKQSGALATLDFVSDSGNMQSMLKEQKQVCSTIRLQKNCIVERKE